MTNENAENIQTAQVAPAPAPTETEATQSPAEVKADSVSPVEATTEKKDKQVAAFVKMRQELRELKQKAKAMPTTPTPPAAGPVEDPQPKPVVNQAPAPVEAEVDIETENAAISEISKDADLAKIPGAIIDLMDMIDGDKRLTRLYKVDPLLAFREAKGVYLAKAGVAEPPIVPKSAPVSGGITTGQTDDLQSMLDQIDKLEPGTKKFTELARKIDAAMKRGR